MSNVNITEVRLLSVPLENDYKITLYFDRDNPTQGKEAQTNYFLSKVKHTFNNCSYQRKDKVFRAYEHIDNLYDCNYVMYKNSAYSNRWFYAFITDLKYVDDGRTDVYIETDVMQTWMFDYTVKPSFVEREHTDNDSVIGENTIPEGLETGEYIVNKRVDNQTMWRRGVVIGCTLNLQSVVNGKYANGYGGVYNGIGGGVKYYYFNTFSDAQTYLDKLAEYGQGDSVVSVFTVPRYYINTNGIRVEEGTSANSYDWVSGIEEIHDKEEPIERPLTLDGYKPINNKLLTFPYCYLLLSNNSGGSACYHYELFGGLYCNFKTIFSLTPGCSIRAIPMNYMGVEENTEYGLTGGKFPICSWANDVYTNWLTQNSLNLQVRSGEAILNTITSGSLGAINGAMIGGGYGAIGGAVTGLIGGVTQGVNTELGILAEKYQHSLQPPQAEGNINSGDVTFSNNNLTFSAYTMTIKREFAQVIDEFFSVFGYKTNRIKEPNKAHRKHYWFTKTVDVNLDGAIPQADLQKIKNCYNNGITFWRNDGTFADYSRSVMEDNETIKKV